jgi:signal transduction histidine kinase
MNVYLSIFKKGLLLIAVPLIIQAAVLGMMVQSQADASSAQRWAIHTKDVIARVEGVYRRLLEAYAGARMLVVSNNSAVSRSFRDALDKNTGQVSELRALVVDNPSQQKWIDKLAAQSREFGDWLAAEERRIQSGERGEALDLLEEGTRLLGDARTTTDLILGEEARLDDERLERLERTTERQRWIVVLGGAAFLGTTLALTLVFLQRVVKRLAVLRENARSYAAGKAMGPQLSGGDEIALVDRAFHEMAASLDQQKQENEMFVYSVSHDLRSPLINLQGFSEELSISCRELADLFRHRDIPAEVRRDGLKLMTENVEESIRYIQTAVGRLARIIDSLLRLSRAGRVEYQWQLVDIASIVQKIIDALHDSITAKKAEVVINELAPVEGDPLALEQIFANLISNAVQYLDPARSGKIEVGCLDSPPSGQPAGFHVYYVRDNGLGIAESYHQRVFAIFSRLHANVAQGEGVGLALVRRMVERHGGKIWLESAAGAGTTFFVALRARQSQADRSPLVARPAETNTRLGARDTWQPSRS